MRKVVLYSTHCPKCEVLKKELIKHEISFEENNDIDLMISKGFSSAPILVVDDVVKNYTESIHWIKEEIN